jgi:hypothetical protein
MDRESDEETPLFPACPLRFFFFFSFLMHDTRPIPEDLYRSSSLTGRPTVSRNYRGM